MIQSLKEPLEHVLAQVNEAERKNQWLRAATLLEKAEASIQEGESPLEAGEIRERVGSCLKRAAMQAESREDFREKMQHAIKAYEAAQELYEKVSHNQNNGRALRCQAIAKYLGYWLASTPSEKRKTLDESLELEEKALKVLLEAGEKREYARTYNELFLIFFCRIFLEWNRKTLKGILERGMKWGEKVIDLLRDGDDRHEEESAWTYLALATCLSDAGFYLIAESEEIDPHRLKAIKYLTKAAELAEAANDTLLLGLSHLWLGINSGEEEAAIHHENSLECGRQTQDNFLIAHSLDYLAYDTYWKARARALENPELRKELTDSAMKFYEEAHHHYNIISFVSPRGGLIGPPSGQAEHYYHLALWESDQRRRSEFLRESETLGIEALRVAENSDMPMPIAQVLHVVSKTLQDQARVERNPSEKKKLLEKALEHRKRTIQIQEQLSPFFYWNRGVMLNYLAGIEAELADIEPDLKSKVKLLEKAAASKEKCLDLCYRVMPDFERKGEITLFAGLRDYQEAYATLLMRLYNLTAKHGYLEKAISVLKEAVKSAQKLDLVSHMAGLFWKIAKTQDTMGEYLEAARSFRHASNSYIKAAQKTPKLASFYRDHSVYMLAWNEIEKAKNSHKEKRYGEAMEHYEKAANLHETSERWSYLAPNYSAWARLEEAEDLSRRDRTEQAVELFQKAANLFQEARTTLQAALRQIENLDEKDLAERLIKALIIREEYSQGRIFLEEGKILSRQGANTASSEKYRHAADEFEKVLETIEQEASFTEETITKDRQELTPIIYLCRAWEIMAKAEAEASPELYSKAAQLFDKAKEHSFNEKARLLALGHSRFCKALAAGTEFEDSRDTTLHERAIRHLESAANHYVKAGFKTASEYAKGTQRLFDAYIYMDSAKKEVEPEKKAKLYVVAEKVLQTSIKSYLKARYPAKAEQVQRLLEKVKEEKELALSLHEVLLAPTITSSTASFVTPTPSEESAVGLERFDHASIQAEVTSLAGNVSVGENLNLDIQLANVGKGTILLAKLEGAIPHGFELISKPEYCQVKGSTLNMGGKRLDPLKIEDIRLVLRAFDKGTHEMKLRIIYVDETGHEATSKLNPVTVESVGVVLPDRLATGFEKLDTLLLGGIPKGYTLILAASASDEADRLIRDFLETGGREGQVTFYVTTKSMGVRKMTKELQPNFHLFICNPQADAIVEDLPNVVKLKGVENLTAISIALTAALRKLKGEAGERRACIAIISDVLLQHHAINTRRWLTSLIPELKSKGFTTLATIDPGMHPAQEVQAVLDLFDGEISIYEKEDDKVLRKYLQVRKLHDQKYLEHELVLKEKM